MSIGRLGLAILLALAGLAGLVQPSAAQTNVTALNHCANYLMNTGAFWGDPSNPKWQTGNAIWLCQGVQDTATPPGAVQCFNSQMATGVNWAVAIRNCRQARGQDPSTADAVYAALEAEMRAVQGGGAPQMTQGPTAPAGRVLTQQQFQILQQQQAQQQQTQTQQQPFMQQPQAQQQTAQAPQGLSIAFSNPLNTPVDQFLFVDGQYTHYYTLQPGETVDQPSSPGLEWVFSVQGQTRGNYVTTDQPGQAYVIGTAAVASAPVAPQQPFQPQQPQGQPQGTPQGAPQAVASLANDARTVRMVEFSQGAFVQMAGGYWGEVRKSDWKVTFVFQEVDRDTDAIRLRSPLDGKNIALDLPDRKIYYGYDSQGGAVNPLYDITSTAARSRIPGSALAWENQNPPPGTAPQQTAAANPAQGSTPSSGGTVPAGTQTAATGPASADGNVPSNAFAADMYNEDKKVCGRQNARLGPGENMMTQTLGVCSPIRTQANEFVVSYRNEELVRTVNFTGGVKLRIVNNPNFQAWIDASGKLHLAVSTQSNSIGIEGATRTKQKQGPFLRTMSVEVAPGIPMQVEGTFPLNGMGSTMASNSKGYNVGASVGANVGSPMATGLNANLNAGYSDTTTASYSLDEFKVVVRSVTSDGRRAFDWKICAWESLTECYTSGTSMVKRGFLGGLENELINAPPSAFRMDGFKSDIHYTVTDAARIRQMATGPIPIYFDYDVTVNTVEPASNDGGFTRYGKTSSANVKYRMVFLVDMTELAKILIANPRKYGAF